MAAAQAAALEERRDSGRALPADQQLCLAIAETFLKLGRIPPAAHLLQRAQELQGASARGPAGDAARRDAAHAAVSPNAPLTPPIVETLQP